MLPKPSDPHFSSGPTRKHPQWSLSHLSTESIGRSHRSAMGLNRIQTVLKMTREILQIPEDYFVAIVPGSCTGALELALWNLGGERPVDVFSWGVFGGLWVRDITNELKLKDVNLYTADDGHIPDLNQYNPKHDCVLTWNETTTGVCIPDGNWIPENRQGLVVCDATSAVFAKPIDWSKLDATAFSWQKCLGGEAGQGMLVLSPRAVERLESYTPPWPIPRLFRIKRDGKLINVIFEGMTIITPSLLCVEDAIDALTWCQKIGGLEALVQRSQDNLACIEEWVRKTPWVEFMAQNPQTRSSTSICLKLVDIPEDEQREVTHKIRDLLAEESVAFDIAGHKLSSPCLRIWGGPMIETEDIQRLLPWLEWAYKKVSP